MSRINLLFAESEQTILDSGNGDTVTVLTGPSINKTFVARLDVTTVITLEGLNGPDSREQTIMRVLDPPPAMNRGDFVQARDPFSGQYVKWKILKRENNPAQPSTDFWLEHQIVPMTSVPIYTPPPGKKFLTNESGAVVTDEYGHLIVVDL